MKRSLLVHEQRIIGRVMTEHDLKVSLDHTHLGEEAAEEGVENA
jgi:hypothetical protein